MPREKKIERYPKNYFTLMERAYKRRVTIECGSETEAVNLRAELYVFRTVLIRNPGHNPRAAYCASHIRFKVDGSNLHVEPKPSSTLGPALKMDQEKRMKAQIERMKSL